MREPLTIATVGGGCGGGGGGGAGRRRRRLLDVGVQVDDQIADADVPLRVFVLEI